MKVETQTHCMVNTVNTHVFLRYCEFARATAEMNLKGEFRVIRYIGFLNSKQMKRVDKMIRDAVYQSWDNGAPPPSLQLIAWSNGVPHWPSAVTSRFPEGTAEFDGLMAFKKEFDAEFPPTSQSQTVSPTPGRVGGQCDYSVETTQPFDINREISLPAVSDADFTEGRPVRCFPFGLMMS